MSVGVLTLEIRLPGCKSLKEKRGRLKPLLARLHRNYNISAAEVDLQDKWQASIVAVAAVSNDRGHTQQLLQKIADWVEREWRDVDLVDDQIELL